MKRKKLLYIIIICIFSGICYAQSADDITTSVLLDHEKRIDLIKTNLDYVWVLIASILVFFMQAGFMALESGMARSKNSINVSIKNLTDFVVGFLGFWLIGFGIMFGKSWNGLFGFSDFLIDIDNPWTAAFFMFQAVFVGTAATIDSGAVCGRTKLKPYILISFLLSVIIYPVFGHWAWGSFLHGSDPLTGGAGWLEAMGFKDFAGSSVVHSIGGWVALAGVIIVGPRIGRFRVDPETGKKKVPVKIHPSDMRFVFLGTFILFFCWYGFNCGSTLSATTDIAAIALNTTLAACMGCVLSSTLSWMFHPEKKIEGEMIANGVLAGLVGITAGCAFVSTASAAVIGAVAGVLVYASSQFIEKVLKLDDVVGAIPVHGVCGAWGTIAVGFFIRPELLGEFSRGAQIRIQFLGAGVCFVWAFGLGLLIYFLVDKLFGGVRVSKEEELIGLNIAEHGAQSSILELANTMDSLTRTGNFSDGTEVEVEEGTEIGDLAKLFNKMISKVREALEESKRQKEIAESMLRESELQKSKVISAQKELAFQRKESEEQRTKFINETRVKVHSVTDRIEDVHTLMNKTTEVSAEMNSSFGNLVGTLERMLSSLGSVYTHFDKLKIITDSTAHTASASKSTVEDLKAVTGEIEQMVESINEIANKTQILSINSSIEAARSGNAGAGFIVIAQEIRKLSERSLQTADKIGIKLDDIDSRVIKVSEALNAILGIVEEINNLNSGIIGIIDENHQLSASVQEQSLSTVKAVESVHRDIANVISEASELSKIGKQVEKELSVLK